MTFEEKYQQFLDAREREEEARAIAFADVKYPVFSGRYWLRALTPLDMVRLQVARCSLIVGGRPTKRDVFNLLVQQMDLRGFFACHQRAKLRCFVNRSDERDLVKEASDFVDLMTRDRVYAPSPAGSEESQQVEPRPVFWAANQCALFMRELGMSRAEYMSTPYPILNQLKRDIYMHAGTREACIDESEELKAQAAALLAKEAANNGN